MNENSSAALGAFGAAGCLGLLGWLLFRPSARGTPSPLHENLDALGALNAAALLYGTVGGLGMAFSLFVSPQIRSVNRVSVFIAFFSLTAVAACLDRWCVRPDQSRGVRAAGWAGLALLAALGLLDQGPRHLDIASHKEITREFRADRDFFRRVQAAVPAGTMVCEWPYEEFPEGRPAVESMDPYGEFRPYLQTEGLRWSFGAIKGTAPDQWQQHVAALPLAEGVRALVLRGFGGVLLERAGYPDHGAAAEATLRRLLGSPAAEHPGELFFTTADHARTLRAGMGEARWQAAAGSERHRTFARFGAGFTGPESKDGRQWYWCGLEGRLALTNTGDAPQRVRLTMDAQTGRSDLARLTLGGTGFRQTWTVGPALQPLTATLDLPPGESEWIFTCDGLPIDAPQDLRVMVWSPSDFRVENVDLDPPPAAPDAAGQAR